MQTLITHCRQPRRALREFGVLQSLCALSLLGAPLAGLFGGPIIGLRLGLELVRGEILHPVGWPRVLASSSIGFALVTGLASIVWPIVLGMKRLGLFGVARSLALLPVYYALLTWACWRALLELWVDPHSWAKTEHGAARRSRRFVQSREDER